MNDDFKIQISKQIGVLEQTADSAHKRIDGLNKDIKGVLEKIEVQLKELNNHMIRTEDHGPQIKMLVEAHTQRKGANAVLMGLGGLMGVLVTAVVGYFFK